MRNLGATPSHARESLWGDGDKAVGKWVDKRVFLCTKRWIKCG